MKPYRVLFESVNKGFDARINSNWRAAFHVLLELYRAWLKKANKQRPMPEDPLTAKPVVLGLSAPCASISRVIESYSSLDSPVESSLETKSWNMLRA
jgi:hypothetical protein